LLGWFLSKKRKRSVGEGVEQKGTVHTVGVKAQEHIHCGNRAEVLLSYSTVTTIKEMYCVLRVDLTCSHHKKLRECEATDMVTSVIK
jgi:hypothetical protein